MKENISISTTSKLPLLNLGSRSLVLYFVDLKGLKSSAKQLSGIGKGLSERFSGLLEMQSEDPKEGACLWSPARDKNEADLCVCVLPKETEAFFVQSWARDRLKTCFKTTHQDFYLCSGIKSKLDEQKVAYAFGLAVFARTFLMPLYGKKLKDRKAYQLKSVHLHMESGSKEEFLRGRAEIEGTNLVRSLGYMPPNELNTGTYGRKIQEICKQNGLSVKFHSNAKLREMGAEAFTAVDRGDPDSKGGIYEIDYAPKKAKNKKLVALVGKGLCYDTGGYDVKTGGNMAGMKGDMQGSAVALATILMAKKLDIPLRMKAFLGITENHISPKAYRSDEVITALNGISIEVIHTDAEGRMVLADVLCLASNTKPELIMDFATLTGSAVRAIGTSYGAAFTNAKDFHGKIVQSGVDAGERVWTFPLDSDFGKHLESGIADTIQCSKTAGIDHILAAFFLAKFVGEGIDWVHLDLAAAENKGGLGPVDTEYTGYGVRFALEFLRKQYKI